MKALGALTVGFKRSLNKLSCSCIAMSPFIYKRYDLIYLADEYEDDRDSRPKRSTLSKLPTDLVVLNMPYDSK